ncbi:N-acetylmannosaminyltransferase [Gemmatimonadetes bacterium T265]|nr:N-acetylmannosaminyltransferase [Gemmatimonadetes bacterium T265]
MGELWVDVLTRGDALHALDVLVARGEGGAVFTPNVDHVVMAERDEAFRAAYAGASLSLADGAPVVWASHVLRPRVPEKLSGSDMLLPIARLAASRGWRVYLLGGGPGSVAEAARRLRDEHGVHVVGTDDARIASEPDPALDAPVVARLRAARPDLVFVALGAPKQELFIARSLAGMGPVVAVGVGASLDFLAGTLRRSPAWMSRAGLEWLYRLGQEPRRLWRRYLIQDPKFVLVVLRTLCRPRRERVSHVPVR